MKELTDKEVDAVMAIRPKGRKENKFFPAIAALEPGKGLLIEDAEYPNKYRPSGLIASVKARRPGYTYSIRRVDAGWVVVCTGPGWLDAQGEKLIG